MVVEGGDILCTDLASATPFAYPCSYNGDWFDDDVIVDDDVSDGAIEVPGDDDGVSVPIVVVLFAASSVVVVFVIVFGIPHIVDSVVLTKSSFDDGLLGSHIAAFCSGVNDDVVLFTCPWAIPKFANPVNVTMIAVTTVNIIIILRHTFSFLGLSYWRRGK
jgi:hypothetical protein